MRDELSIQQERFVQFKLTGHSTAEAGKLAGISEPTAHRWMKLPDIQDSLARENEVLKETARDTIIKLYTANLEASCTTVTQIMLDAESPAASRLKAAAMIQDRLAPASADMASTVPTEQNANAGIDWAIFTSEELAIILPIFQQAEKRAAGVLDMRKKA